MDSQSQDIVGSSLRGGGGGEYLRVRRIGVNHVRIAPRGDIEIGVVEPERGDKKGGQLDRLIEHRGLQ